VNWSLILCGSLGGPAINRVHNDKCVQTERLFQFYRGSNVVAGRNKQVINWKICILCQNSTYGGKLIFPNNNKKNTKGEFRYKTLAKNLLRFHKLGLLSENFDLKKLDNGSGIAHTLQRNDAKFHKQCFSKYSVCHIARAGKRLICKKKSCAVKTHLRRHDVHTTFIICCATN